MKTPASASGIQVPRVLVLVATYNGGTWVTEQLASIFRQRDVSVVVCVSDDRSTDRTVEIVRMLASRHANLKLEILSSSSGSAGANFRGLLERADFSGFDYVALADQDDIWDEDHLYRGCSALKEDSSAGGCSCAVQTFGNGARTILAQCSHHRPLDFLFEGAGQGCTFVLTVKTARLVQLACLQHPSLTSALHYHDWLIYLVNRCAGLSWVFDQHVSLRYRQHAENEIGARSGSNAIRRRFALIRSGWYRRQVAAALLLALELDSTAPGLVKFGMLFRQPPRPLRNLRLALWAICDSRRRFFDRLIIGFSALVGWL